MTMSKKRIALLVGIALLVVAADATGHHTIVGVAVGCALGYFLAKHREQPHPQPQIASA